MFLGRDAERGSFITIFDSPQHPYTRALLNSIPEMGGHRGERLATVAGMVPSPANRPSGCPFHDRCGQMIPGLCDTTEPAVYDVGAGHQSVCHLSDPEREVSTADGETSGAGDPTSDAVDSRPAGPPVTVGSGPGTAAAVDTAT